MNEDEPEEEPTDVKQYTEHDHPTIVPEYEPETVDEKKSADWFDLWWSGKLDRAEPR